MEGGNGGSCGRIDVSSRRKRNPRALDTARRKHMVFCPYTTTEKPQLSMMEISYIRCGFSGPPGPREKKIDHHRATPSLVPTLEEMCLAYIEKAPLTPENVPEAMRLAVAHNIVHLVERARRFAVDYWAPITRLHSAEYLEDAFGSAFARTLSADLKQQNDFRLKSAAVEVHPCDLESLPARRARSPLKPVTALTFDWIAHERAMEHAEQARRGHRVSARRTGNLWPAIPGIDVVSTVVGEVYE